MLPDKVLSTDSRIDVLSRMIARSAILISLLQILFFAVEGITAIYSIVAIAIAVIQIVLSLRRLKTPGAGFPSIVAFLYIVQFAIFLAKPMGFGPDAPLRLLQVALIGISFAGALVSLLSILGPIPARFGIILLSLMVVGGLVVEMALPLVYEPKAANLQTAEVSRIIPEMKDIAGPAGLKVAQNKLTVYYRGDPNSSFRETDPRESEWVFGPSNEAHLVFPRNDPDAVRIEITKLAAGADNHIQLRKHYFHSKANEKYVLTFRARADKPREMVAGFGRAHGNWEGLGLYVHAGLTPKWENFAFDFTARADDDNACIHFNVGSSDASVELSGVHLRNLSEDTLADPVVTVPGTYTITYNFNAEGCRGANYSAPKADGAKRILLLGDSFVLGAGIPEEATVSSQLEHLLNADAGANSPPKYQVINCGQSGYGTHDERLFYELLGADYRPDLVLTAVTWQDDLSVWEEQSPVFGRFENLFFTLRALRGHLKSAPHTDFTRCVQELRQLEEDTQKRGTSLGVFIFRNNADYSGSTQSGKTWNKLTKTITEGLQGTKIPLLDTGKVLRDGNADDLKAHAAIPQDPNETAHLIAARELLRFLRERQLVTQ
jgi:hypothetical protein